MLSKMVNLTEFAELTSSIIAALVALIDGNLGGSMQVMGVR